MEDDKVSVINLGKNDESHVDLSKLKENHNVDEEVSVTTENLDEQIDDAQMDLPAHSFEDKLLQRKQIMQIKLWLHEFPDILGKMHVDELEELSMIVKDFEYIVGVSNCHSNMNEFIGFGTVFLENVLSTFTPLNLNAPFKLSEEMNSNKQFQNTLKEFKCKYSHYFYTRVEYRLLQGIFMCGAIVHYKNTAMLAATSQQPKETDQNIDETLLDEINGL
mmetsp:Transcript_5743/g.21761  ORF Transcript_5743/g.21761 Transcript_5743/m.21761 type:complete len:219 (-) Transcript_5743:1186-1842(-)